VTTRLPGGGGDMKGRLPGQKALLLSHPSRKHSSVGWGGMDWIHLAQDRDQRRAVVNMVKNLQLP
jgi:hypothetical protein